MVDGFRVPVVGRIGVTVVALVLAWSAGRATAPSPPPAPPDVDTVAPAVMVEQLEALQLERDGLRARLRGIESRPPRVIIRTDTLVQAPDTVFQVVAMDARGGLSAGALITPSGDTLPGLRAPEVWRGFRAGNCDDGWSISAEGFVCDPARLGHLWLDAAVEGWPDGALGLAGLRWRPSYRSGWGVGLWGATDGTVRLRISRGWEIW